MRISTSSAICAIAAALVIFTAEADGPSMVLRGGASGQPLELVRNGEVVLRLHPAGGIDSAAERNPDPRVLYPFADGAAAGRLQVLQPLIDARGTAVPPGEYELQYRVQPPLKEHVDTTEYRDFLLLRRAPSKTKEHPLVLALVPAATAAGDPPRLRDARPLAIDFDLGGHRVALPLSFEGH